MSTLGNLPDLEVLLKGSAEFGGLADLPVRAPFDEDVLSLLAEVSDTLRRLPEAREFPDVMAFSFFFRNAQLKKFQASYADLLNRSLGRGVTFHIAPSNVPIIFAYSLAVGLLSGNACIVRVSQQPFPQVDIVVEAFRQALGNPRHQALANQIAIVRYGHSAEINRFFSSICDVRIIWGGDNTITEIRKAPLPPSSSELTFPDRYSALVIQAKAYLAAADKQRIASAFYNDTYQFDQGACSSPRLVYWVGDAASCRAAQEQFWNEAADLLEAKSYLNEAATSVNKYVTMCRAAIDTGAVAQVATRDNRLLRVSLSELAIDFGRYECLGGIFFEYVDADTSNLAKIVTKKLQTLTYFGFEPNELLAEMTRQGVQGVDRIVPIGDAGVFSLLWDGYDIIRHLSRTIAVQ